MDAHLTPGTIFLGLLGVSIAVVAIRWWSQPERRARRAVAAVPTKPLAAVVDGERVHLKGVARAKGNTRKSPYTGRSCIGYRFLGEGHVSAKLERSAHWVPVHEEWHCDPFVLVDDGVEARVEGPFVFGLAVSDRSDGSSPLSEEMIAALHEALVDTTLPRGGPRTVRYREARLEPGDLVSEVGVVSSVVDPAGQRETPRDLPRLRVISGTEKDPVILANGDVIEDVNDSWEED